MTEDGRRRAGTQRLREKAQRDKGTKGQRHRGTKAHSKNQLEQLKSRRRGGSSRLKAQRLWEMAQRDRGTKAHRDRGTEAHSKWIGEQPLTMPQILKDV